jgi:hypothetical protein
VLGYKEGNTWVAHSLELDLVGEGTSWKEACSHLEELIDIQVSFAIYRNNPAILYRPAPGKYFKEFDKTYREVLSAFPKKVKPRSRAIANLPLPLPKRAHPQFALGHV